MLTSGLINKTIQTYPEAQEVDGVPAKTWPLAKTRSGTPAGHYQSDEVGTLHAAVEAHLPPHCDSDPAETS